MREECCLFPKQDSQFDTFVFDVMDPSTIHIHISIFVVDWTAFATGVLQPQNGPAFCAEEDGRAWVCMYPSSRRFRCDLETFPMCGVVCRVIREDTRKDAMYIDTALNDEEDKKDLGGRTLTTRECMDTA